MSYLAEIAINRELVLEFLLTFARFEFALKATGYARGDEHFVEPDWKAFATSIRDVFDKNHSPELARACDLFHVNPPNQQVLVNGALAWSSAPIKVESETELLVALVKRVRNNLFHGGKYNAQVHEETARSEALLSSSLYVLAECLRVSPKVRSAYEGAAI